MGMGRVKHSKAKARAARERGGMIVLPREFNVRLHIMRTRNHKHPYLASACFVKPGKKLDSKFFTSEEQRTFKQRSQKFDRCADGRGGSPTIAIKRALSTLSKIVK